MKKILSLLIGSLLVFLVLATPTNLVKAEGLTSVTAAEEDNCECHDVTVIDGVEKIKIVLSLVVSKEFITTTIQQLKQGNFWNVTKEIEVMKHNASGTIMVGVPFKSKNGTDLMAAFFNGTFMGISPANAPHQ